MEKLQVENLTSRTISFDIRVFPKIDHSAKNVPELYLLNIPLDQLLIGILLKIWQKLCKDFTRF